MSSRGEKERRRQERLAAERAEAARAARRKDRVWYGGIAAVLAAAAVVLAVGLSSRGGSDGATLKPVPAGVPAAAAVPTAGVPTQIPANLRDADKILDGQIADRLSRLKGVPVVVNMWASWCPNCKAEFPFFQELSRKYARRVAFLGLDSQDQKSNAADFLKAFPVSYPSIYDETASQAISIGAGRGWPTTLYYDRTGQQTFVREGGYATVASLDTDIHRHALGA
jgi:thiol-disulfide isomerase/thioredoxin